MISWHYWNNFGIHYLMFTITSIKMILDAKSIAPADVSKDEISPYWSFNETADISKYEDFDHKKFLEHELHLHVSDPATAVEDPPPVKLRTTTVTPTTSTAEPIIHVGTTNVTVQLGSTALLHCEIANLSEKMVSWVRRRDWHILSSGVLTYINDGRFRVFHSEKSDDWDLRISPVAKIDNGTYECQVGTGTGIMTHYFNLFVIVPTAVISGNDEYHIGEGSSITLYCKIENGDVPRKSYKMLTVSSFKKGYEPLWYEYKQIPDYYTKTPRILQKISISPVPPQYVLWYHNGKMISSSHFNKNGLKTDRLSTSTEQIDHQIHSRLTITKAIQVDTGNYTCQPPNTDPDSTYIHITPEFDNTAAIQRHKSSNSALLATELSLFPLTSFLLIGHNEFRWIFL